MNSLSGNQVSSDPDSHRLRPTNMAAPEEWLALSGAIKASNSELTEDLIVEILLKLRIKKLTQYKTVCKQWLRLISSPSFAFRHSQRRTFTRRRRPRFFIFCSLVTAGLMTPVSFSGSRKLKRHPRPHINLPHIKTCSDGLVSYKVFSFGYGIYCLYEVFSRTLVLWNPTTTEHKVLPPSPSPSTGGFYFGTVDYKDGNFAYKIGRVTSRRSPNSTYTPDKGWHESISLELYSSKTESWKVRPDFASGQYFGYSDNVFHCANLNGRAHWVKQSEDTYITTFDYETEIFGRIKAPSPPQVCCSYNKLRCLVTLFDDKFLCLGLTQDIDDKWCYFDIWVMREYGDEDSWTKELTVGPIRTDMEVLEFSSKPKGLFLRHRTHSPTELLFWDCKSSSTKSYCTTERRRLVRGWLEPNIQVLELVGSLVSVFK